MEPSAMHVVHTSTADGLRRLAVEREALGSWFASLDGPGEAYDPAALVALAEEQWPLLPQLAEALRRCTWAWPLPWTNAGYLFVPPERAPEHGDGSLNLRRAHDVVRIEFMRDAEQAHLIVVVRMEAQGGADRHSVSRGRPDAGM